MKEKTQTELGQSVIDPNTTKPVKGSAAGLMPRVSIQSADQNPSSGRYVVRLVSTLAIA